MPTQYLAAGATYDKFFQQQLLIHLVHCPGLLQDASQVLQPDDFELPIMRVVWEALITYYRTYKNLPNCTVLDNCIVGVIRNADQKYTSAITEEEWPAMATLLTNLWRPGALSEPYYREQLAAYIKWVRSFKAVASENANIRQGGNASLLAQQLVEIGKQVDGALGSGRDQLSYLEETGIIEREEDIIPRVSTGLHSFDALINGGLALGQLGMITGCPGMGKSNFLINLAVAANSLGDQALIVSLELSTMYVKRRWTAMTGCIKGELTEQWMDKWPPAEKGRYELLKKFESDHNSQFITVQNAVGKYFTPAALEAGIESWKATVKAKTGTDEHCTLVGVDWLDWMHLLYERGELREDMRTAELVKELKFIAERQHVALWTATQGTRTADGKAVLFMRDTAYGYHKNDPVDVGAGLGIHPESQQAVAAEMRLGDLRRSKQEGRRLVLALNKNRHGSTGVFDFYMAPTLRFYESTAAYERHELMLKQPEIVELLWPTSEQAERLWAINNQLALQEY